MYYSDQEKNAIISLPVLPFIVCQASAGVTIVPASGGHIPAQAVLAAGLAASSRENWRATNLEANLAQVAQRPQNGRHLGGAIAAEKLKSGRIEETNGWG